MQIISSGDNLHGDNLREMSEPVFWEKIRKYMYHQDNLHKVRQFACQNLFSGKNKKSIINLLYTELAQREVKINDNA